jgi:hypothetical protein
MVQAILEGRKTQTRRVVKHQDEVRQTSDGIQLWTGFMGWQPMSEAVSLCRHGVPGDRLWVREGFARVPATAYRCSTGVHQTADPGDSDMCVVYREGWERSLPGGWRSPIFMPRWASRITLEITEVRIERLQAISEADAVAEGSTMRPSCNGFRHANPGWSMDWSRVGEFSRFATAAQRGQKAPLTEGDISLTTARFAFANFFDRIHGAGSWDTNPWVWVIEFKKVETVE